MSSVLVWSLLLASSLSLAVATPLPRRVFTGNEKKWGNATYVTSISQCPPLPPRSSPPTSVHDLRPDDFVYTMVIGDSITAGAFSRGLQSNSFLSLSEWRGQSYAAGMDDGAVTIPNFMRHYNSAVTGGSKGSNGFPEICFGFICLPKSWGWNANVNQLNAAQTGALASNLPHEVNDYLLPQVAKRNISRDKFKYINFQIGSNDLCWLCAQATIGIGPGSANDFESNIRETLEALRAAIPNTLVNLLAVFKVSDIFEVLRRTQDGQNTHFTLRQLTLNEPYCSKLLPIIPHKNLECACSLLGENIGAATREQMDLLTNQYNARLLKIATDYQAANYSGFAVVWQPPVVSLGSYPIEALSDVDCFHPSLKSHGLLASGVWNRVVAPTEKKAVAVPWSTTAEIRCLQDDRIFTKNLP